MRKRRQDVFLHSQCPNCQFQYENTCPVHFPCEYCPMYIKPRRGIYHNCHCLAQITTEERKSGKCKFFKQKEVRV